MNLADERILISEVIAAVDSADRILHALYKSKKRQAYRDFQRYLGYGLEQLRTFQHSTPIELTRRSKRGMEALK